MIGHLERTDLLLDALAIEIGIGAACLGIELK